MKLKVPFLKARLSKHSRKEAYYSKKCLYEWYTEEKKSARKWFTKAILGEVIKVSTKNPADAQGTLNEIWKKAA